MLIIPFDRKIDWKNPPLITLLLLLANCLVFLLFQLDDDQQVFAAEEFYISSGLQEIELPHYQAYIWQQENNGSLLPDSKTPVAEENIGNIMWNVQTDPSFQELISEGKIISDQSQLFPKWSRLRKEFVEKFEAITFVGYGLRTQKPSFVTLLSHMFLHGGIWHLFGNCIFLLAVGFLVELTLGRSIYLTCYLLTGFGSAGFDFIFNSGSLIPGIGASGAISGLMGMYAVLYGFHRIRFFYSIGIYFDYIRLPAIALLPMWICNEVIQIILYSKVSNVNYLAHLGGLVTGATIAFMIKRYTNTFNVDFLVEDANKQEYERKLQQVRVLFDKMEYQRALIFLRGLFRQNPKHRETLCLYYACSRFSPEKDEYHDLSHAIFNLNETDIGTDKLILETYNEYLGIAKPSPRLPPGIARKLSERFLRLERINEMNNLIRIVTKNGNPGAVVSQLLLAYSELLNRNGLHGEAARYQKLALNTSADIQTQNTV